MECVWWSQATEATNRRTAPRDTGHRYRISQQQTINMIFKCLFDCLRIFFCVKSATDQGKRRVVQHGRVGRNTCTAALEALKAKQGGSRVASGDSSTMKNRRRLKLSSSRRGPLDKESTPMDRKPSRSALCPSKGEERAGDSISTRLMYLLILKNNCAPEITCDDYFEPCIGSSIESPCGREWGDRPWTVFQRHKKRFILRRYEKCD